MRDPEARARMGRAALERARRFTWESQESAYLGAYAQALGAEAAKPAPLRATG